MLSYVIMVMYKACHGQLVFLIAELSYITQTRVYGLKTEVCRRVGRRPLGWVDLQLCPMV